MKNNLARILMTVLAVGLLTVNACAAAPTVTYPGLADSPFIPSFTREAPPAPTIDTPFVPECCFTLHADFTSAK